MRVLVVLLSLFVAAPSFAEEEESAQATSDLRVTVLDQTHAALVIASVTLVDAGGAEQPAPVDSKGQAFFAGLAPGAYRLKVSAEAFESSDSPITLKRGQNAVTVTLPLAGLMEEVVVLEETQDLRGAGFTTSLSDQEIAELPEDPDELEQMLMQMAGPGATMRVNGFRGGRLPPKSQIRQIRFRMNSYAADNHEGGGFGIDIVTKPGMSDWRGRMNFGFRDEALNARNYFADALGPEQYRRFGLSADGPLVKGKTSVALNIDGNANYDSQTIVAVQPGGVDYRSQVRRPWDEVDFGARIDHALTDKQTLMLDFQGEMEERSNLGVGDFDLPTRSYTRKGREAQVRASLTGLVAPKIAHELKVQFRDTRTEMVSEHDEAAIVVIDAFSTGGAGQFGDRRVREVEIDDSLEFSPARKHTMRVGVQVEQTWVSSLERRNFNGTFTFASIAAYLAGQPTTYTQRAGTGEIDFSQWQAAWYVQDEWAVSKLFSLSLGLRHEFQAHLDDYTGFAPRAGFTWTPGKYTVRGGWGIFNEWYGSSLFEQTLRVDGITQQDLVIRNPGYPDPFLGSQADVLPPSVIRASADLKMPWMHQASIGVERTLFGSLRLQANYFMQRGRDQFRSYNANAPLDSGVRPDVLVGNITVLESTGLLDNDRLMVNVNWAKPEKRLFLGANYQLARVRNFADSPFALPADNYDLGAEWGPSARDTRHRAFGFFGFPLPKKFRGNLMVQGQSASPYNIITGLDDNGDTVVNDRPEGTGRNAGRGEATWNINARLSRGFNFGPPRKGDQAPGPGGPIRMRGGPGGPGGGGMMMSMMEPGAGRYNVEFYVQAFNLLNHANFQGYSGSLRSPYFGQPISAGPARRLEAGVLFGF